MEKETEGQPQAAAERQAGLRGQREARGRVREDHLAAGRRRAVDEGAGQAQAQTAPAQPGAGHQAKESAGRLGSEPDNDDVSELSENDSSGG